MTQSKSTFKKKPLTKAAVDAASEAAAPLVPAAVEVMPAPSLILGARQGGRGVKYVVGQIYDVPTSEIAKNPFNPRVYYSASSIDEMVMSLNASGQEVSATAFLEGDNGVVTLIDGEKRLRAAMATGIPTLRVEIRPKPIDSRRLYESARSTNLQRSAQSPLDDAIRWTELLEHAVYPSQIDLAQCLGLKPDEVSRTLSLAKLPKVIHSALTEFPDLLKLRLLNSIREFWGACDELALLDRDERTLDLIREISLKSLGYREVEARRKSLATDKKSKPHAQKDSLMYGSAKGELKVFPGGRLELNFKGLDQTQVDQLREVLTKTIKAMDA